MVLVTVMACAQEKTPDNVNKSNVLIDGYDVVSYFDNTVTKGSKEFTTMYDMATLYFSSQKNKDMFVANPEKYFPQYGGWCAYAIGETKEKVSINPKTYKIMDGKLYLFYNKFGTNTLKLWNKDEEKLLNLADQNWPDLR